MFNYHKFLKRLDKFISDYLLIIKVLSINFSCLVLMEFRRILNLKKIDHQKKKFYLFKVSYDYFIS